MYGSRLAKKILIDSLISLQCCLLYQDCWNAQHLLWLSGVSFIDLWGAGCTTYLKLALKDWTSRHVWEWLHVCIEGSSCSKINGLMSSLHWCYSFVSVQWSWYWPLWLELPPGGWTCKSHAQMQMISGKSLALFSVWEVSIWYGGVHGTKGELSEKITRTLISEMHSGTFCWCVGCESIFVKLFWLETEYLRSPSHTKQSIAWVKARTRFRWCVALWVAWLNAAAPRRSLPLEKASCSFVSTIHGSYEPATN